MLRDKRHRDLLPEDILRYCMHNRYFRMQPYPRIYLQLSLRNFQCQSRLRFPPICSCCCCASGAAAAASVLRPRITQPQMITQSSKRHPVIFQAFILFLLSPTDQRGCFSCYHGENVRSSPIRSPKNDGTDQSLGCFLSFGRTKPKRRSFCDENPPP